MNLVLNPDVIQLNPSGMGSSLIALARGLSRYTADKIHVQNTDCQAVRELFRGVCGEHFDVNGLLRNHFQFVRPFDSLLGLSIVNPPSAACCPSKGLEWASRTSSVSVGSTGTAYGVGLVFELANSSALSARRYDAIMVSELLQLGAADLNRWLFVKSFNDVWTTPEKCGVMLADQHQHCRYGRRPPCADSVWTKETWVSKTRNTQAFFRPGIAFAGERYLRLIAHILRAAYAQSLFLHTRQNGFIVDVGANVGSSNGQVVSHVQIYITAQNVIHIRPTHGPCQVSAPIDFPLDR